MPKRKRTQKNILSGRKSALFGSICCVALVSFLLPNSAMSCHYTGLDYFNIVPGHGIKYHVTDDDGSLDCNVWAVSRPTNSGEFAFTLNKNGSEEDDFFNSWFGGAYFSKFGAYMFDSKCPVDNQAGHYSMFSIPQAFDSGNQWTVLSKEYRVDYIGEYSVNGTSFCNCLKVTLDNSDDDDENLKGTSYFILAKYIGIVQVVFDRNNGNNVLFEYLEHGEQALYTFYGTVSSTTGGSVEGLVIQLSNCDDGVRYVLDSGGEFTLNAFGPDAVLRIGYDENGDGEFDPDSDYPKEYHVNCLTSEVTTSDTGLDLQVTVLPEGTSSTTTTSDPTTTTSIMDETTTTTTIETTTTTVCETTTTTTTDPITTTTVPVTTTIPDTEMYVDFMVSPSFGVVPLTVYFTNLSQGNTKKYSWHFGDGSTSLELNPVHTYTEIGSFGVSLTAYGSDGSSKITAKPNCVLVIPQLPCGFSDTLDSQENIGTLRTLRNSLLDNIFGLILTSIYYQNSFEIASILNENPELQDNLRKLVSENIAVAVNVINKGQSTVSNENVYEVIDFLNDLKSEGSLKLKADLNIVIMALQEGYFLYGLGVEME